MEDVRKSFSLDNSDLTIACSPTRYDFLIPDGAKDVETFLYVWKMKRSGGLQDSFMQFIA